MEKPKFIENPFGEPILKTVNLLAKDLGVKQIADVSCLSDHTVEGHTKIIRAGMHCTTIYGALLRMIAVGLISRQQLIQNLPAGWEQYILL